MNPSKGFIVGFCKPCKIFLAGESQKYFHDYYIWKSFVFNIFHNLYVRERSGSMVECLTGYQGASGLSLTGVTVSCP